MGGETPRLNFHSPAQFSSNLSLLSLFYSILRKHWVPVNGKRSPVNLLAVFFFFSFFFTISSSIIYTRTSSLFVPLSRKIEKKESRKKEKKRKERKGRAKNKEKRKERRGKYETPENLLAQRHRSVQRARGSLKNCKTGKFTGQSGNHQMFNVGGNTLAR